MFIRKPVLITILAIITIFTLSSIPASAQVAIDGGSGLFHVQKAKPLGDGNFAVGLFYKKSEYEAPGNVDISTLTVPLTAGFGDSFEFSIAAPWKKIEPATGSDSSGMTDGIARAKWNFSTIKKYNIHISGMVIATLPLGDKNEGLGTDETNLGFGFMVDKGYEKVSWHANVWFLNRNEENVENQVLYGAGVEWSPVKNLGLIAEVSGLAYSDQNPGIDDNTIVMVGGRYYIDGWGSVEAGYASKSAGDGIGSPHAMFMAGATITFGRKAKPEQVAKRESKPVQEPKQAPVAPVDKPASAPVEEPTVSIILTSVHFKFDSSTLTSKAKQTLKQNSSKLTDNPEINVLIEGNTCSVGTNNYNAKLGERRAMSVMLYMVRDLGVPENRLSVRSRGENNPQHTNKTGQGRSLNRRVDFTIKK